MDELDQKQNQSNNNVRDALDERARKMEHHLSALRRELTSMVPPVKETIIKHPIGTTTTVLGVGVVLGYLLAGGRRRGGRSNGTLMDAVLAPVIESVKKRVSDGETSEEAVRGALSAHLAPQQTHGSLNELVKLLLPIGVEMGLKALDINGKAGEAEIPPKRSILLALKALDRMGERTRSDAVGMEHRLVFLGPPGSGKGTQARILAKRYGFQHISTGVILRKQIRAKTELGYEARKYIEEGRLVPDQIVRELAEKAILDRHAQGFILDGYPRTIHQAEWLDEFLASQERSLTRVLNLVIEDEDVVRRLSQRRINRITGENFHLSDKPPPEDQSEDIVSRPDDQPDAIRKRLRIYHEHTHPLVNHYCSKNLLHSIPAVGSFSEVHSQICEVLTLS